MMRRFPMLMMALVLALMVATSVGMVIWFPNLPMDPTAYYAVLIGQELLVFGLPAWLMRPWKSSRIEQQPTGWLTCGTAFLLGYALQIALWPVNEWWMSLTGGSPQYIPMPENTADWVLLVIAMTAVPALLEEAFFRGGLLGGLLKTGGGVSSVVLASLFFTMMHMHLGGLMAHLVSGAMFTFLMLRWGRIYMPMLAHFGFNLAALTADMLGCGLPESITGALIVAVLLGKLAPGISWIPWGEKRSAGSVILAAVIVLLMGAGYVLL